RRARRCSWRAAPAFWRAVRLSALWGFLLAVATTLAVLAFGGFGIDLLARDEAVRAAAKAHLFWAAITATTGVLAFLMDGVFVGASLSRDMRNTTILAFATFAVTAWALMPALGNLALWIALNAFLLVRGLSLAALLPRRARSVFSPTG
ncbi:MAG TPA: MATE family efflux transporter, partial [Rhizobiaceae bacterium]|nr:MATE family efflux transporter [Rhizobiaceae bacterium]